MKKILNKQGIVLLALLLIYALCWYFFWQSNALQITKHSYYSSELPAEFKDFKIVHISDLHNTAFGHEQSRLLKAVAKESPDIIIITGDIIDRRRYEQSVAMDFIEGAVLIAPVYFCSGNHEAWSGRWQELSAALRDAGVMIADERCFSIERNGEHILLAGLSDPAFGYAENSECKLSAESAEFLQALPQEEFILLLAHRPEYFEQYSAFDIELVFSGHAHGGQVRLPFVGALFAPGQGILPQYTAGEYEQNGTTLFVSRGLGNSIFPLRIGNRPHIISLTLMNEK